MYFKIESRSIICLKIQRESSSKPIFFCKRKVICLKRKKSRKVPTGLQGKELLHHRQCHPWSIDLCRSAESMPLSRACLLAYFRSICSATSAFLFLHSLRHHGTSNSAATCNVGCFQRHIINLYQPRACFIIHRLLACSFSDEIFFPPRRHSGRWCGRHLLFLLHPRS